MCFALDMRHLIGCFKGREACMDEVDSEGSESCIRLASVESGDRG